MTLTIELPATLEQQFRTRQIPEEEITAVILAALEIWLAQRNSENESRFIESAAPFTQRLISQNRELFEILAHK